jgi:hypothetical protein
MKPIIPLFFLLLSCAYPDSASSQESPQRIDEVQVTTSSGTVRLIAKPKSIYISTLADRRLKLETIVTNASADGSLPENLKTELMTELARIRREEEAASAQASQSANSKVMGLARSLDDVGFKINNVLKREVVTPLVQGTQFAVSSGDWIDIDDVAMRRWDLEGRIAKLVAEGRMTQADAAETRKTLDAVGEKESAMRADGDLDVKESRVLYTDFDRIASQIDRMSKRKPAKK